MIGRAQDLTGAEMRAARKARRLTQQQASELIGVSLRTYLSLEGSKDPVPRLHANAFRWVFEHEEQMQAAAETACAAMSTASERFWLDAINRGDLKMVTNQ